MCCALTEVRRRAIAAFSSVAATRNISSTSDQNRSTASLQTFLLRRGPLGRCERFLQRNRLREIDAQPVEDLLPRHERIGLDAIRHVAHRCRQSRQVVLDAQQLQRVFAIALADGGLLVAKGTYLVRRVKADTADGRQRQAQAHEETRRRRSGHGFSRAVAIGGAEAPPPPTMAAARFRGGGASAPPIDPNGKGGASHAPRDCSMTRAARSASCSSQGASPPGRRWASPRAMRPPGQRCRGSAAG